MSHLVLQFQCNSGFRVATDYHELRSQQRAAHLKAQALPVPLLLAEGHHADDAQQDQHVGSEASALGYRAALAACDCAFTDTWDKGQIADLLLDEGSLQRVQAKLQPSKFHEEPRCPATASAADVMQLLVGDSLAAQMQRSYSLEPFVFPPAQQKVRPRLHATVFVNLIQQLGSTAGDVVVFLSTKFSNVDRRSCSGRAAVWRT